MEIESECAESEEDSGSESRRSRAEGMEISADDDTDSESDIKKYYVVSSSISSKRAIILSRNLLSRAKV